MTARSPTPRSPWFSAWPRGMPREIHVPRVAAGHYLDVAAQRYPDKAAIVFCDRALCFADLKAQADALAGHLQRNGTVAHGDRVLLMSQNCPQFTVAFYAILRCGAVVVPINAMSTATELAHYIENSGARVAVVAQDLLAAVRPALDDGRLQHAVVHCYADALGEQGDASAPDWVKSLRLPLDHAGMSSWTDAIAANLVPTPVDSQPDDLCLLPYTSGTTGQPKGCRHTHSTLLASTIAASLWRGLHAEAVVLGVAPLFHLLGLQNAMLMPMSAGATVVMMPRWDAATAARLIEQRRVTTWAAPPAMLNDFFSHPDAQWRDLSSLAVLNGGGAAMPEAVSAMLQTRFGIGYIEGYGMSETASFLHCNPLARSKRQCLGIPAFGVDSRIVDPETLAELAPGETGELVTAAPQVMLGYWHDPEADAAAFFERNGRRYLRTGDLARMDEEGYFFMQDRLKRMINVSGFKVWPAELECLLFEHPAVFEACVIAVPDQRQGESVKAVVVVRPGAALEAEALQAWCRERMAAYKVPRFIEFRPALPKSGTGKVAWRALQEEAAASATATPVSTSHASASR